MALSPDRWFWAVMTVYVMFLNARSRGDTIYRGVQRLGGTLLGILSGVVLGLLLVGLPWLQLAALLLSTFGMYYLLPVAPTIGVFSVTILLGMVYEMMGVSMQSVLLLRLEETAIGAVVAILVAAFVLPTRTRDQVRVSGHGVLLALADAVRASRDALAGKPDAAPLPAMRRVDRQVADLRLALAPLQVGGLLRRTELDRPLPTLLECVHWARVLAAASADGATVETATLDAKAARIEARLTDLAQGQIQGRIVPPDSTAPVTSDSDEVATALTQLDAAVTLLAERLAVGVLDGFTLGS